MMTVYDRVRNEPAFEGCVTARVDSTACEFNLHGSGERARRTEAETTMQAGMYVGMSRSSSCVACLEEEDIIDTSRAEKPCMTEIYLHFL